MPNPDEPLTADSGRLPDASGSAFEADVRFRVMLLRTARKLTLKTAAEKSGTVNRAVWGKIEAGGREVTLSIIQKIAATLDVPPGDITGSQEAFAECVRRVLEGMPNDQGHTQPGAPNE